MCTLYSCVRVLFVLALLSFISKHGARIQMRGRFKFLPASTKARCNDCTTPLDPSRPGPGTPEAWVFRPTPCLALRAAVAGAAALRRAGPEPSRAPAAKPSGTRTHPERSRIVGTVGVSQCLIICVFQSRKSCQIWRKTWITLLTFMQGSQ